jgi:adenylate cyclase
VEATSAALAVQEALASANAARDPARRMLFRIGVNLGDIIEQRDGTVYGDGVNLAARAQALSTPGAIALSARAHAFLDGTLRARCRDGGEQVVKEGEAPLHVYHIDVDAPPAEPKPAPGATTRPPARPSIAVMPFTSFGGDGEDSYFADGMTEDIITELSRFQELIVTARNSTFAYRNQAVDLRQVGRELRVRYVLEGSVRRAGARIRVTAQLIDAENGHHLWAERFDRKLEDVFEVQDELTRKIVATLAEKVSDHERRRLRNDARTDNLEAYELVLRGRDLWFKFTPEDNARAQELYQRAIALDPGYARAYASLAWSYIMAYNEYWSDDPQAALDHALDYALTGVTLAPTSHVNRNALGMVYYFRKQLGRSIEALSTALELNPNDASTYVFLAQSLSLNGENERAIELLDKAFRLNPHLGEWPRSIYVIAYFNARRYAEAATVFERLEQPRVESLRWAAALYAHLGREADARRVATRYRGAYPRFDLRQHLARIPFARRDDLEHYGDGLRGAGLGEQSTSS